MDAEKITTGDVVTHVLKANREMVVVGLAEDKAKCIWNLRVDSSSQSVQHDERYYPLIELSIFRKGDNKPIENKDWANFAIESEMHFEVLETYTSTARVRVHGSKKTYDAELPLAALRHHASPIKQAKVGDIVVTIGAPTTLMVVRSVKDGLASCYHENSNNESRTEDVNLSLLFKP